MDLLDGGKVHPGLGKVHPDLLVVESLFASWLGLEMADLFQRRPSQLVDCVVLGSSGAPGAVIMNINVAKGQSMAITYWIRWVAYKPTARIELVLTRRRASGDTC